MEAKQYDTLDQQYSSVSNKELLSEPLHPQYVSGQPILSVQEFQIQQDSNSTQPQPIQQQQQQQQLQQGIAVNLNQQQQSVRCKLPSPFDGGFADIISNPQDFLVMPPVTQKKGFFDKVLKEATKFAHKATEVTKNYVDNKKLVLCTFCTACQVIDNKQLNFYCASCRYLNYKLWTPPRKSIFCGYCSVKQEVDLGTNNYVLCTKCSRWNLLPLLRPLYAVSPNHPNLNSVDQSNAEATARAQEVYQRQLEEQQKLYAQKQN